MEVNQEQIILPYSKRQDNTFNRDEAIQKYLEKEIPKGKSTLCRFYIRGCCLFPSQDCKFAHGIEDLKFVRLDLEEFEKNKNVKNNTEESCAATEEVEQPSLMLEMTYKTLYEYQFILKQKKEISKTFTQSEINQDKETRYFLRDLLLRDIYQDFLNMLFAEYNTRALRRAFIGQCLLSIGLKFVWKFIFVKDAVYEVKSQSNSGTLIVKQLAGDLFDTFMEDCIIKIIKDQDLLSEAPISPAVITKWYYQYLGKQDPFLPAHHVYLTSRKIKTIDEYLDRLQNSESFITKLALQCKRTLEEMNSMILFSNSSSEMNELIASIKSILPEVIEESEIGFVLYSVFENRVLEKCAKRLQQFNNNLPQIKKLMAKIILEHNIHIMSFDCNPYLFSPTKFEKVSLSQVYPKFTEGLHTGCSIKEIDHLAEHNLPTLNASNMNILVPERQTEEFLAAELDMEKVVLVDSEDTLKAAIEHFATVDTVSVDLEGALCKGGRLELIQCASRTKVFVFDIYRLATMAREGNNNDMALYNRTVVFLKNMMEDSKICKVFHDGRQDSVAIHVFLNACVSNVFDTSAVHLLLEYLEKYAKKKNGAKVVHEEEKTNANANFVLNVVEEVKLPGLNEVLEKYEASNGPNRLKYIMRSRFSKLPVEYFLNRPIDKEFLIYSARDVEDLVEVKERMEEKLNEALKVFINDLDSRMITLLWKFVSKIYCRNGCEHNE